MNIGNVVDGLRGRGSKRHPSLAANIRNGEVSDADNVHPNDDIERSVLWRWKFSDEDACKSNFVGKLDIYEVRRNVFILAVAPTMADICFSNSNESKCFDEFLGDNTACGPGIPKRLRSYLIRSRRRRCARIVGCANGNVGENTVKASVCLYRECLRPWGWNRRCGHPAIFAEAANLIKPDGVGARSSFAGLDHERSKRELLLAFNVRSKRRIVRALDSLSSNHKGLALVLGHEFILVGDEVIEFSIEHAIASVPNPHRLGRRNDLRPAFAVQNRV